MKINAIINAIIVVSWVLFGLYFGIGGWAKMDLEQEKKVTNNKLLKNDQAVIYQGISFKSYRDLQAALENEELIEEKVKIYKYFPWIFYLPSFVGFVITAGAFGALGGVTNILKQIAIDNVKLEDSKVMSTPIFGFLVGLLMLGISYVFPSALTFDKADVKPTSLLFLCMFGGIFSGHIYNWLENFIKSILPIAKRGP